MRLNYCLLFLLTVACGCHSDIKKTSDNIYSRHLQKHINLSVISTPLPKNKSDLNLLIVNDANLLKEWDIKNVVDTYYSKKLIKPLIIVGVEEFDPEQEYGVAGFTENNKGTLAVKYNNFIVNELLPFIKKKSGVTKFNSITIAGSGRSGISAFDIAWENWQIFDRVGYLGDLNHSLKDTDYTLLAQKIAQSRKRPRLQFWLRQNDYTNMQQIFDILDKKGIQGVSRVGLEEGKDMNPHYDPIFPFLAWIGQVP
ncbi:MAG TPA: alpha/beta hydrolase-fold protein [Hanamia sp.]